MSDLTARLREEGLGFGIGPAVLCQEAAERIEVLEAAIKGYDQLSLIISSAIRRAEPAQIDAVTSAIHRGRAAISENETAQVKEN